MCKSTFDNLAEEILFESETFSACAFAVLHFYHFQYLRHVFYALLVPPVLFDFSRHDPHLALDTTTHVPQQHFLTQLHALLCGVPPISLHPHVTFPQHAPFHDIKIRPHTRASTADNGPRLCTFFSCVLVDIILWHIISLRFCVGERLTNRILAG